MFTKVAIILATLVAVNATALYSGVALAHTGSSITSRQQDSLGNYAFGEKIADGYASVKSRSEVGDGFGNKQGSYSSHINHAAPAAVAAPLAYAAPIAHHAPVAYAAPFAHAAPLAVAHTAPVAAAYAAPIAYSATSAVNHVAPAPVVAAAPIVAGHGLYGAGHGLYGAGHLAYAGHGLLAPRLAARSIFY